MNIVFMGSPGAGKGTQSKTLAEKYGACHLSSGDILREVMGSASPLGDKIKSVIGSGALLGDDLILEIMTDRLDRENLKNGIIMDGFPRTVNQATQFDELLAARNLKIDYVVDLVIDDSVLIDRITGRFSCGACGEGYHDRHKRPLVDNTCDVCGAHEFVRRSDDTEEVLATRLRNFRKAGEDLLAYYKAKGLLVEVDGLGEISEVQGRIEKIWQTQVRGQSC